MFIGTLYEKLVTLGRSDATLMLTSFAPLFINCTNNAQYHPNESGKSSRNSVVSLDFSPSSNNMNRHITGSKIHTDV